METERKKGEGSPVHIRPGLGLILLAEVLSGWGACDGRQLSTVTARTLKQSIAKAATSVHAPSLAGFTRLELPLCNFFSFFKKSINLIKKYELIPSPPASFVL